MLWFAAAARSKPQYQKAFRKCKSEAFAFRHTCRLTGVATRGGSRIKACIALSHHHTATAFHDCKQATSPWHCRNATPAKWTQNGHKMDTKRKFHLKWALFSHPSPPFSCTYRPPQSSITPPFPPSSHIGAILPMLPISWEISPLVGPTRGEISEEISPLVGTWPIWSCQGISLYQFFT